MLKEENISDYEEAANCKDLDTRNDMAYLRTMIHIQKDFSLMARLWPLELDLLD